jgi:hypothetical protein
MANVEDYGSKSEIFHTNDDIERKVIKAKVGDNFADNIEKLENGDPFLLFCVISHCTIVKQCLKMVRGTNGTKATCF